MSKNCWKQWKRITPYNKNWKKNWKQVKRENLVSLIYPRGGGWTFLLWNIFCFLLLLINLIYFVFIFFSLFFACVCVISFSGSFIILFWCYLIKNEINITKKECKIWSLYIHPYSLPKMPLKSVNPLLHYKWVSIIY